MNNIYIYIIIIIIISIHLLIAGLLVSVTHYEINEDSPVREEPHVEEETKSLLGKSGNIEIIIDEHYIP